jgi:tRNA pseudouridine55 synthase
MTEAAASARRAMDGILVIAKPAGPTSHDVVALVRRLAGARRVGHGGTLDPFASGVLPVFLGLATRVVEYHMGDSKGYRATVCFGATSTTDDRGGELTSGTGPAPSRAAVEAALGDFRGRIEQRPPAFSALKIAGRRAYQLAREGKAPALHARPVVIERLDLVEWDGSDLGRPVAVLEIECGAGTYVRSVARDLGEKLGCGAYLGALVRTVSGPFGLAGAHSLEEVREAAAEGPDELARLILPLDTGLAHVPAIVLEDAEVVAAARGQQVRPARRPEIGADQRVRLLDERGALVGMGLWRGGQVAPDKMFIAAPGTQSVPGGGWGAPAAGARPAPTAEPRLRRTGAPERAAVVSGIDALSAEMGRLYVAVGVFDGLHRGHLYLLRELRRAAERSGSRPAVITFDAHPDEVIRGLAPAMLCDPGERLVRLAAAGVEVTVVQHFDAVLRGTPYQEFVGAIAARVELAGFAMTGDAAFGYERQGTPEALGRLGEGRGFGVTVVPSFLVDGEQVRSSQIRKLIGEGDLKGAQRLLGRWYAVTGRVVGRDAGQDVVRLEFDVPYALPPAGSYQVLVGPAWDAGLPAEPATEPATAKMDAVGVTLVGLADGAEGRLVRVVFVPSPGTPQRSLLPSAGHSER